MNMINFDIVLMKKQTPFQISIPEPCHEKWEDMTAVERGRFCASCQKVVTDFTQMEDTEIIRFLKEGKGHCGRFNAAQLDRPLIASIENPRYFVAPIYKKIAASLLIVAAFAEKTFAQQKKQNSTQQQVIPTKKSKAPVIISGHLLDFKTQKPLSNRTVFLKNDSFELQIKTNKWGGFTFTVPKNQQQGIGTLKIDTTGTSFTFIDEEISLEKSIEDLQLFCYGIDTLNQYELIEHYPTVSGGMHISNYVIERTPSYHLQKATFWNRISKIFKKHKKKQLDETDYSNY